jgi:topoisomerase-4 subunit B
MSDLFKAAKAKPVSSNYSAEDISKCSRGWSPCAAAPACISAAATKTAMHHLINEVFDNAMDEAVAGHASLDRGRFATRATASPLRDNGRGIPVDPHPKFPKISALEVISHHAACGRKVQRQGLSHGGWPAWRGYLGRERPLRTICVWKSRANSSSIAQDLFARPAQKQNEKTRQRAKRPPRYDSVTFHPDAEIFGAKSKFRPEKIYKLIRSKAYLFRGVEMRWKCDPGVDSRRQQSAGETR